MSTESDFFTLLTTDAELSAIIGDRAYPDLMPQAGTLPGPTLVFKEVAGDLEMTHGDGLGYVSSLYQFDIYASTRADAFAAREALKAIMLGLNSTVVGSTTFSAATPRSPRSGYEPETRLFRASADWEIIIKN
jgi:hypothetical protein